jgi:hypothetical protein
MDILAGKFKSVKNLASPFSATLRTMKSISRWLIEFFTVNKEERMKAGIYLGGEGREE